NTGGASNQSQGASGGGTAATGAAGAGAASGSAGSGASGGSGGMSPSTGGGNMTEVESVREQLLGKSVFNENNDKIGDINDVVLGPDNKATEVVVGVGGFIGVGERKVAVPFDRISKSTDGDKLILAGYTKDQLKEMPEYQAPNDRDNDNADRGDIRPAAPGAGGTRGTEGMGTGGTPGAGGMGTGAPGTSPGSTR